MHLKKRLIIFGLAGISAISCKSIQKEQRLERRIETTENISPVILYENISKDDEDVKAAYSELEQVPDFVQEYVNNWGGKVLFVKGQITDYSIWLNGKIKLQEAGMMKLLMKCCLAFMKAKQTQFLLVLREIIQHTVLFH